MNFRCRAQTFPTENLAGATRTTRCIRFTPPGPKPPGRRLRQLQSTLQHQFLPWRNLERERIVIPQRRCRLQTGSQQRYFLDHEIIEVSYPNSLPITKRHVPAIIPPGPKPTRASSPCTRPMPVTPATIPPTATHPNAVSLSEDVDRTAFCTSQYQVRGVHYEESRGDGGVTRDR